MSGNLFGSCINGNPCSKGPCLPGDWVNLTYPQFGDTFPASTSTNYMPISTNSQKTVYGGLLNSRRIKQSSSMYILAKGSLTTVNNTPNKSTLGENIQTGTPNDSYTNVGGPGDQNSSVPLGITGYARGNKARVYSMPGRDNGVDVKHGSYNRYLARKKGLIFKGMKRCYTC